MHQKLKIVFTDYQETARALEQTSERLAGVQNALTNVSSKEREEAIFKLDRLPRRSSVVRLRNRCFATGRPRGVMKKFKMSRLCFREMALKGEIPGVTKASW